MPSSRLQSIICVLGTLTPKQTSTPPVASHPLLSQDTEYIPSFCTSSLCRLCLVPPTPAIIRLISSLDTSVHRGKHARPGLPERNWRAWLPYTFRCYIVDRAARPTPRPIPLDLVGLPVISHDLPNRYISVVSPRFAIAARQRTASKHSLEHYPL